MYVKSTFFLVLLIAILAVNTSKAGLVTKDKSFMYKHQKIAKREAARGGARVPHKTICGRRICGPDEYKGICGATDSLRYVFSLCFVMEITKQFKYG